MKNSFITAMAAGVLMLLASCETYPGIYSPRPQHPGIPGGGQHHDCDNAGVPVYGYEKGRPIYGYTQVGRPVHALNQLYAGCYVPSWGPRHLYPRGVRFSACPPRLYDNSNIEAGDAAPGYRRYY